MTKSQRDGERVRWFEVVCACSVLVAVALAAACSQAPGEVVGPSDGRLEVVLVASGYDFNVYVNGSLIGRLEHAGQMIARTLAPGGYSLTLRDNAANRDSYPFQFAIVQGGTQTITLGSGDTQIVWR